MSRILALVLALWALPLFAQPAEEAQPPVKPATQGQPAQESGATQDAKAKPSPPPAAKQAGGRDENPFDYEASEQISEDLSVSFPVDI